MGNITEVLMCRKAQKELFDKALAYIKAKDEMQLADRNLMRVMQGLPVGVRK